MASTIKVDKLDPQSGTALEIGTSGDTVTVPSGVGLTLTDSTLLLPTTITSTTEVKTNKISPATGTDFALGDSGDTFTVPSGATIVNSGTATGFGGGSWTLIKTQTVVQGDAVQSLDFVDGTSDVVFDATYKLYKFLVYNWKPSAAVQLKLRVESGGSFATTGYITENWRSYYSGASSDRASATDCIMLTRFDMNAGGSTTTDIGMFEFLFSAPAATQYPQCMGLCSGGETGQMVISMGSGKLATSAAYTGVRFYIPSGNMEGEFSLYGITT